MVSNYFFNKRSGTSLLWKNASFSDYVKNMKKYNDISKLVHHIDCKIDFVGKYENFKKDFDKLNEILGTKNHTDEKHPLDIRMNSSWARRMAGNPKYQELYNDETRKIIENKYREDLDVFDYKF